MCRNRQQPISMSAFAHPCMGHFLSSTFFDVLLLPFAFFLSWPVSLFDLRAVSSSRPCHGPVTPRAAAVKDGRRRAGATNSIVARPRLDGGEHGVTRVLVGT